MGIWLWDGSTIVSRYFLEKYWLFYLRTSVNSKDFFIFRNFVVCDVLPRVIPAPLEDGT